MLDGSRRSALTSVEGEWMKRLTTDIVAAVQADGCGVCRVVPIRSACWRWCRGRDKGSKWCARSLDNEKSRRMLASSKVLVCEKKHFTRRAAGESQIAAACSRSGLFISVMHRCFWRCIVASESD